MRVGVVVVTGRFRHVPLADHNEPSSPFDSSRSSLSDHSTCRMTTKGIMGRLTTY